MRRQIHSDPFSARHEAVQALLAAAKDDLGQHDLQKVAVDLDSHSISLASTAAATAYAALAGLMRILDALVRWRWSVLSAQPEADRFLRTAKERYKLWVDEYRDNPATRALIASAAPIQSLDGVAQVSSVVQSVAHVPLPVPVFEAQRRPFVQGQEESGDRPEARADLTVAFLKFQFDGRPAIELQHLSPGEVHDLEVEVRVSRWPEDKGALVLTPVSVEPKSTYDFPSFRFEKPAGDAPYTLHQRGRAIVLLPQGMHARPFEFKYSAEFVPKRGEQPIAVVGHRTLLIEGTDVSRFQVSGYEGLDRRLFELRDALRRRGGIPQTETEDALLLLAPLCNLAGRAVQDAEFPGAWSEAQFQKHVRAELRRNALIGSRLDEHAHAAGGITDLSLGGIPIELKVERGHITSVDGCEKYFAQTASYAVAKGKRTSVLCVLDSSDKSTAPVPPETLLDVRHHAETNVTISVLVVQGNLPRPSALSR